MIVTQEAHNKLSVIRLQHFKFNLKAIICIRVTPAKLRPNNSQSSMDKHSQCKIMMVFKD